MADGDPGAQRAGAGARQADRPAAGSGPPAQRGRGGRGLGQRRRQRVPRQLPAGDPPGKGSGTKGVRWLSSQISRSTSSAPTSTTGQRCALRPLTEAMRELIQAGIHTDVDEATVREAQSAIEAAATSSEAPAARADVDACGMRPPAPAGVGAIRLSGLRNAIAPPMVIHHEPDGRCVERVRARRRHTRGRRAGCTAAFCALVLDHILGEAASDGLTKPMFTGTITLRYLRGTPLGRLRAEACDRADRGHQDVRAGYLSDAEGKTVEAEGMFIKPAVGAGRRMKFYVSTAFLETEARSSKSPRPQMISATTGWAFRTTSSTWRRWRRRIRTPRTVSGGGRRSPTGRTRGC